MTDTPYPARNTVATAIPGRCSAGGADAHSALAERPPMPSRGGASQQSRRYLGRHIVPQLELCCLGGGRGVRSGTVVDCQPSCFLVTTPVLEHQTDMRACSTLARLKFRLEVRLQVRF